MNRREYIESALRLIALQAIGVKRVDDISAARFILVDHIAGVGKIVFKALFQSGDARPLRRRRRAEHHQLVHLAHGGDQILRTRGVAKAPSGHGECLAKAVEYNGTLQHARNCGKRNVMLAVKGQLRVDFIRNDQNVRPAHNIRNRFQIALFHDCSRWVGREREKNCFRLGRDGSF